VYYCLIEDTLVVLVICFVLFSFYFETGSYYVAQAGLNLIIFLPVPPQYWDYRCEPPRPAQLFALITNTAINGCVQTVFHT
jgi:hypothetical protein